MKRRLPLICNGDQKMVTQKSKMREEEKEQSWSVFVFGFRW